MTTIIFVNDTFYTDSRGTETIFPGKFINNLYISPVYKYHEEYKKIYENDEVIIAATGDGNVFDYLEQMDYNFNSRFTIDYSGLNTASKNLINTRILAYNKQKKKIQMFKVIRHAHELTFTRISIFSTWLKYFLNIPIIMGSGEDYLKYVDKFKPYYNWIQQIAKYDTYTNDVIQKKKVR